MSAISILKDRLGYIWCELVLACYFFHNSYCSFEMCYLEFLGYRKKIDLEIKIYLMYLCTTCPSKYKVYNSDRFYSLVLMSSQIYQITVFQCQQENVFNKGQIISKCLQFPPKNEQKQVDLRFHSSKVQFVHSFLEVSFRLCLHDI